MRADKFRPEYIHKFVVTGGAFTDTYVSENYGDALDNFLTRVRHTKPLSGCVIEFWHHVKVGDLIIDSHLEHRVVLD